MSTRNTVIAIAASAAAAFAAGLALSGAFAQAPYASVQGLIGVNGAASGGGANVWVIDAGRRAITYCQSGSAITCAKWVNLP